MPADSEPSPKSSLEMCRYCQYRIELGKFTKITGIVDTEILCLFRFDQFDILWNGKVWIVNNQMKFSWFVENIFERNHLRSL